jgi:hypothetical protein
MTAFWTMNPADHASDAVPNATSWVLLIPETTWHFQIFDFVKLNITALKDGTSKLNIGWKSKNLKQEV